MNTDVLNYFEKVPSGVRQAVPSGKIRDKDQATVICPISQKSLVFELIFDTFEGHDAFLESRRSRTAAIRHGGRLTILTPYVSLDKGSPMDQQGRVSVYKAEELSQALGVTAVEMRQAWYTAWDIILGAYA